jgi:predicted NAD/FAD-binding protein
MNHGLLSINDRPQWRTVAGGSRNYVRRIGDQLGGAALVSSAVVSAVRGLHGVTIRCADGSEHLFDQVVFACHADQTMRIVGADVDSEERDVLSAFRFQDNEAVLHRDAALMPRRRAVWASWNYQTEARRDMQRRVGLTYWMNLLQGIPAGHPLFVSLNPLNQPAEDRVFARIRYEHPLFDRSAIAAQRLLPAIQGRRGFWYAGAWTGFGFHEDGIASGVAVAEALGAQRPWDAPPSPGVELAPLPVRA